MELLTLSGHIVKHKKPIFCNMRKHGFLYLSCVLDLFDRKPIGWSISDKMNVSHTVIPSIRMANRNRPFADGMIFHSGRGIKYALQTDCQSVEERGFSALGNLTIDEFWVQYNIKKESIKNVA
jgi:transposase InsO family protein